MKNPIFLLAWFLCMTCMQSQAQKGHMKIDREPSWVTSQQFDYKDRRLDKEAEEGTSDQLVEKQVSLQQKAVYTKVALKVLSEAGVQNHSEINISFDPSYQKLVFHHIHIIRDNEKINQLELSRLKTVYQEKDLKRFIYNGAETAVLFLEDVRKGDIIEYDYSVIGFNPIFNNKFSDVFDLQFSIPIYHLYYKLIIPKERSLNFRNNLTDLQPVITRSGAETCYEWKKENISALHPQDNLPSWYDPYPSVSVSEFRSWKEVNDWAGSLFPFSSELSPELKNRISLIKNQSRSNEERIGAALRFVQDDIRYMGIEMGMNSHKPHLPDIVLRQRFGDCKDKSFLLVTILRAMGVEASPVLINTELKKSMFSHLPSATCFDHVTVKVKLDGKDYWFDPTIPYQRGPVREIFYPDYQAGLVLTDTTTSLTAIPFRENSEQTIKEVFTVPDMNGTAKMKVISVLKGSYADGSRDYFKNNSLYDIQKDYMKAYSGYFEKIKSDSITYNDDEKTGIFTTVEYYSVDEFWGKNNNFQKVTFEPYVINGFLKKPKETQRSMPFSLSYPADIIEEIQVNLPEDWKINQSSNNVSCSAFNLSSDYVYSARSVTLKYRFKNLKDHITPTETNDYVNSLNKADETIAFDLTRAVVDETGRHPGPLTGNFPTLYFILGICVLITWMVKKQRRAGM